MLWVTAVSVRYNTFSVFNLFLVLRISWYCWAWRRLKLLRTYQFLSKHISVKSNKMCLQLVRLLCSQRWCQHKEVGIKNSLPGLLNCWKMVDIMRRSIWNINIPQPVGWASYKTNLFLSNIAPHFHIACRAWPRICHSHIPDILRYLSNANPWFLRPNAPTPGSWGQMPHSREKERCQMPQGCRGGARWCFKFIGA